MSQNLSRGMLIAAAASLLLAATTSHAGDEPVPDQTKVGCFGINACAGKGECGTKENGGACAGTNTCKGKGWVTVTAKECRDKGGQILNIRPVEPQSAPASAPSGK